MSVTPAWAPFFSASEVRIFLTLVEAEIRSRGVPYAMGEGMVEVTWDDGAEGLGLSNVAQICRALPTQDWPAAIAQHFGLVFNSASEEHALRTIVHDFDRVRSLLRVRLYDAWVPDQIIKVVADGLVAAAVFDLPSAMRSVARTELDAWGLSDEAIYQTALDNLAAEAAPNEEVLSGPGGAPLHVVEGISYYTASRALRLAEERLHEHPLGGLVIVPNRHVFCFHPIEDERVTGALAGLIQLAEHGRRVGPGSISGEVYWLREGEFVRIPHEVDGTTVKVAPPALFIREVLERVHAEKS